MANATNNYFTINKQKFGDDFIKRKSAQDIQRDAKKKIFKDMVFGNIDYDVDGMYYTDANFLDNLITTALTERDVHQVTAFALYDFAMFKGGDPLAPIAGQKSGSHQQTANALQCLLNTFVYIKDHDMDISCLPGVTLAVAPYRKAFAEFY